MKIAILNNGLMKAGGGGAETVALQQGRALAARGHEVLMLATSRQRGELGVRLHEDLPTYVLPRQRILFPRLYWNVENAPVVSELENVLRGFGADAVLAHNVHAHLSYSSLRAAKSLGARVVLVCHDVTLFNHGTLPNRSPDARPGLAVDYRPSALRLRSNPLRARRIRRLVGENVDQMVAVSHALRSALRQNGFDNIAVVHNSIDPVAWRLEAAEVRAWKRRHGVGDAAILFGGRISRPKGSLEMVDAFAAAARYLPHAQLMVVGNHNDAAEAMLARARAAGVADRLVFTGWLTGGELAAAYHAAALIATPSTNFDSLIQMNLEAMACARPVISTCFGGAREAVIHGQTGYIVNPFQGEEFAGRIVSLLSDPGRAEAMGRAGLRRVIQSFSQNAAMDQVEALLAAPMREPALRAEAPRGLLTPDIADAR